MAYREYTRHEFEAELRQTLELEQVGPETATTEKWRTRKGKSVSVPMFPDGDPYPHFIVGMIAQEVLRLDSG